MTRTLPSGRPRTDTLSSRAARVQAGAESVAAPLISSDAPNVEVLTDFQPADALSDLAVLARLLDARTQISVPECAAALVAARGIHNLSGRHGAVGFCSLSDWRATPKWQPELRLTLAAFILRP